MKRKTYRLILIEDDIDEENDAFFERKMVQVAGNLIFPEFEVLDPGYEDYGRHVKLNSIFDHKEEMIRQLDITSPETVYYKDLEEKIKYERVS